MFWGMPQPIFFDHIKIIPAYEIVSHRSLWSFVSLFLILILFGKIKEVKKILFDKLYLSLLLISGILITCNWIGFIIAISLNRLQDASMGYYLSPIISIMLGFLVLKENLSKLKITSILLILIAIFYLLLSNKSFPLLALLIGFTFAFYGLIRKRINVSSEIGLFFESGFISIFAIIYLIYLYINGTSYFLNNNYYSFLLILTGPIIVFPLFFFNIGVRNIQLGLAGIIFYLAPTFHFLTSIFILKENLNNNKLIAFIIIWVDVIIYIYDSLKKEKINENNTQLLN